MPTVGSITKTVRLNARDIEVMKELMEDGSSWSGAVHKLCEGARAKQIDEMVYRDIRDMCKLYGIDTSTFFREICELMEDGIIRYENGRIESRDMDGIDLSRFKEACKEKGKDVQGMVDRYTRIMLKKKREPKDEAYFDGILRELLDN